MFLIADIGSNISDGRGIRWERAVSQITSAAQAGFDAVKFQLFRAAKLTSDKTLIPSLESLELPEFWIPKLREVCESEGVEFMCTPFYLDAVDIIDPYVDRHKIASWDITYTDLLLKVASKNKPVILSTGASTPEEIVFAVKQIVSMSRVKNHTLLHCTGGYPTEPSEMNMRYMLDLGGVSWQFFNGSYGLSSHCVNPSVTSMVVPMGGDVLEVHYDFDGHGVEKGHSYTEETIPVLVNTLKDMESALSCGCIMTLPDTVARKIYRRNPSDWLRPFERD